jgi:glycosyltransferase involved in cell wall biosynthesis
VKKMLKKLYSALRPDGVVPIDRRVIHLTPDTAPKGQVLLSYIIESFTTDPEDPVFRSHTHYWETRQMVNTFLEQGYAVDLISYRNTRFRPERDYDFFVSARTNFDRISGLLNEACTKVVHLDTAHWVTNNYHALGRLLDLTRRRKAAPMRSIRLVEHNQAIENADLATILGNHFTIDSYAYAGKPVHRIPISSPVEFAWKDRDIEAIRNNYMWFGSAGFVHKGLDLVLELFAGMPDFHLYVCGPFEQEQEFLEVYHRELFETANIHPVGWVDVNGAKFREVLDCCLGIVYPSCAEGGGGSVIPCMHAGLIPVVSYESSVDIGDYGVLLKDASTGEMEKQVMRLSSLPASELEAMSRAAREFAASTHTREAFAEKYREFVLKVLLKSPE